jgi:hypothetical protein
MLGWHLLSLLEKELMRPFALRGDKMELLLTLEEPDSVTDSDFVGA